MRICKCVEDAYRSIILIFRYKTLVKLSTIASMLEDKHLKHKEIVRTVTAHMRSGCWFATPRYNSESCGTNFVRKKPQNE